MGGNSFIQHISTVSMAVQDERRPGCDLYALLFNSLQTPTNSIHSIYLLCPLIFFYYSFLLFFSFRTVSIDCFTSPYKRSAHSVSIEYGVLLMMFVLMHHAIAP